MAETWFAVTVDVPQGHSEAVANFLVEHGSPGLQLDERNGVVSLTAYFATDPPVEPLRRFCADISCNSPGSDGVTVRVRTTPDEDWAANWKKHFPPQIIGKKLYVCPPWAPAAPSGRVTVVIDPGMAFGTGQHATTRGCLYLLEDTVREGAVTRALDVGTGSGVLAIALAKLGVAEVWGVDNDPSICRIAVANACHNGVSGCTHFASSLADAPGMFDLITANLFADVLQELAGQLVHALRPTGTLICSGLLGTDAPGISTAYGALGFRVEQRYEERPWVTVALRRSD
ncbi:MAG: 50S ribosomal protein L11 methyltransferase [Candidatus Binatia bacterium]